MILVFLLTGFQEKASEAWAVQEQKMQDVETERMEAPLAASGLGPQTAIKVKKKVIAGCLCV